MTSVDQRVPVAILGSGTGSNAAALIDYSSQNDVSYRVVVVIASRVDAGIVSVAEERHVPAVVLPKDHWEEALAAALKAHHVAVLALAGFLRKLPETIIGQMDGNVLNIHPALLPSFGGHGMYGIHVHRAVLEAKETMTGATVHKVTSEYDEGSILRQMRTAVIDGDDPKTLQNRVKSLEHRLYPLSLDEFCRYFRNVSAPFSSKVAPGGSPSAIFE